MNYRRLAALGAAVMMYCILILYYVFIWRLCVDILHIEISIWEIIFINILLELFTKVYRFISRKVLESF